MPFVRASPTCGAGKPAARLAVRAERSCRALRRLWDGRARPRTARQRHASARRPQAPRGSPAPAVLAPPAPEHAAAFAVTASLPSVMDFSPRRAQRAGFSRGCAGAGGLGTAGMTPLTNHLPFPLPPSPSRRSGEQMGVPPAAAPRIPLLAPLRILPPEPGVCRGSRGTGRVSPTLGSLGGCRIPEQHRRRRAHCRGTAPNPLSVAAGGLRLASPPVGRAYSGVSLAVDLLC